MAATKRKRASCPRACASEIHVTSSWARHLDHEPVALAVRRIGEHDVWLVDELFSAAECSTLLSCAEAHGFGTTDYDPAYRGNLRLMTTDMSLAQAVWARLRTCVPPTITLTKPDNKDERDGLWWDQYPGAEGVWQACGLNECWRLTKYRAGDRFSCHCDEAFVRSSTEMSMLTVNIYMNSDFEKGRTRFFLRDNWWEQFRVTTSEMGDLLKEGAEADEAVVPSIGLCLIFRQPPGRSYYHDGEEVASNYKYLFRSDVMYRKM